MEDLVNYSGGVLSLAGQIGIKLFFGVARRESTQPFSHLNNPLPRFTGRDTIAIIYCKFNISNYQDCVKKNLDLSRSRRTYRTSCSSGLYTINPVRCQQQEEEKVVTRVREA